MASGRLAPLLVLAGLLVAGIPHLGSPGEAGSSTPAAPAEEAQTPSRAASSDASVSLEAARSAADWVQDRWQSHRQPLVEETRTARAPVELEAGSWASSWFDEDLVFRPAPGAYVLPGTERVDVTVSWATDPPGTPIDARLLVATAEQAPTEFDEATFRPLESGQTLTIPVEARMWDAPYQEASLWWFAVDLEGEPASAPSEVEVSLEADAVREGPPPSVLSTEIPWWGQDHVPLVEDERSNALVHRSPGLERLVHCPSRCEALTWSPETALVPSDARAVEATLTWEGEASTPPELYRLVEPDHLSRMQVVEDEPGRRVFQAPVPDELGDSAWQNRSRWHFLARLETHGEDAGAHRGSMHLSAHALRESEVQQAASPTSAAPSPGPVDGGTLAKRVGGLLASAGVLVWLADKLGAAGVAARLFSRIPDDELLEHPTRRRIVELVDEEPGVHFREIARRLEIGRGNLDQHLRRLVDGGLLEVESTDSHRCYFRAGRFPDDQRRAVASTKAPTALRLLEAARRREDPSLSDLADEVDLALSTVSHHVDRLSSAGVLERQRAGRRKRIEVTELGRAVLETRG